MSHTRLVAVKSPPSADPAVREAAARLRAGEVVAFPTETVYGLGADARSAEAVEQIYRIKGRPADNPLIVHVADLRGLDAIASLPDPAARRMLAALWPGPLTVVVPVRPGLTLPASRGLPTVAVRAPAHPVALALLEAADIPVAAPSANRSGGPSPTTAQHVLDDLDGRIPLILDGGACPVGIESTVLDLSEGAPVVLRPGEVREAEIERWLGRPLAPRTPAALHRSPGTRYRHYSPRAPVIVLDAGLSAAGRAAFARRAGALLRGRMPWISATPLDLPAAPDGIEPVELRGAADFTRALYRLLRALDAPGVAAIAVLGLDPAEPVMDRLRRAASLYIAGDADLDDPAVLSRLVALLGGRDGHMPSG